LKYFIQTFSNDGWLNIDISKELYNEILSSLSSLQELKRIEEKFDLVIENYIETEDSFSELTLRSMLHSNTAIDNINQSRSVLNRRLMNYLSSVKSYIDQTKKNFLKLASGDREKLALLNSVFEQQAEENFEYKIMELIRNFSQHNDFPVQNISLSWRMRKEKDKERQQTEIKISLPVSVLDEDTRIDKKLIKELNSKGDSIDLREYSRGYLAGIWNVHKWIRAYFSEDSVKWHRCLESCNKLFSLEYPDFFPERISVCKGSDLEKECEKVSLYKDSFDYMRFLIKKNNYLDNFRARIFTSY